MSKLIPVKVVLLSEGVLKAMFLTQLKTVTARFLLVALLCGAAGAIYQTQAAEQPAEQPKGEQKLKVTTNVDRSNQVQPLQAADQREYVLVSRLVEAGAGQPKELLCLPKLTVDDGQLVNLQIDDAPENLLEKVLLDEKIKIGTFLDVRVKRLRENKVRLFCSFQRNELEKASASEIHVLGNSVQVIQDVELHKSVKVVFQRDAKGSAQRWVEITVDEQIVPVAAPGTTAPALPARRKVILLGGAQ